MWSPASLLCGLLILFSSLRADDKIGTFWQVTDFHYDTNYSASGVAKKSCHKNQGQQEKLGAYGNFLCDSPMKLVQSAITAMHTLKDKPDFILWTGDNIPHVKDSLLNPDKVYATMNNITSLLKETFGQVPIFPTVGNHDVWHSNQVPYDKGSTYYQKMLEASNWQTLLTEGQIKTFKQGGFYSVDIGNLRIVVLNTVLYYTQDKLTEGVVDPAEQLTWLEGQLQQAQHNRSRKVLIAGHVPPGVQAGDLGHQWQWFYEDQNQRYLELCRKHASVTAAHIYAHEHTDGFHILYNRDDHSMQPLNVMFLGPAVTPWDNKNNPSIRLYQYNKVTGEIHDYQQYYLDLDQANQGHADWKLEYQATQEYKMTDVSPASMHKLAKGFLDDEYFNTYMRYTSVSHYTNSCVEKCKQKQDVKICKQKCKQQVLCAITMLDYDDYKKCVDNTDIKEGLRGVLYNPVAVPGESQGTYAIMIGFMVAVIIMFVALMILFRKGRTQGYITSSQVRYSKLTNAV